MTTGKSLAANVLSTYLFDFHMGSKIDAHRATKLISGNYYAAQRVSGLEGDLLLQTQQQKFRVRCRFLLRCLRSAIAGPDLVFVCEDLSRCLPVNGCLKKENEMFLFTMQTLECGRCCMDNGELTTNVRRSKSILR